MRLPLDERFVAERERFGLHFACESCACFADGECAHGYPTSEHRLARYAEPGADLVFCKEWELA